MVLKLITDVPGQVKPVVYNSMTESTSTMELSIEATLQGCKGPRALLY